MGSVANKVWSVDHSPKVMFPIIGCEAFGFGTLSARVLGWSGGWVCKEQADAGSSFCLFGLWGWEESLFWLWPSSQVNGAPVLGAWGVLRLLVCLVPCCFVLNKGV